MGLLDRFFRQNLSLTAEQIQEMSAKAAREQIMMLTGESYDELMTNLQDPDEADWLLAGQDTGSAEDLSGVDRLRVLRGIRRLVKFQANASRAVRLYQSFVFRSGWTFQATKKDGAKRPSESEKKVVSEIRQVWKEFLLGNRTAVTPHEIARRCYRDGEAFIRKWDTGEWPPKVRFIDPEEIHDSTNPDSKGIITRSGDVTEPVTYRHFDVAEGRQIGDIYAEDVTHLKLDVDSNVKRGESRFLSSYCWVIRAQQLLSTEFTHRKMQAAIVLQRKIKGSPGTARRQMDHNATASNGSYRSGNNRRENFHPGSIFNVNEGTEIEFKQPLSSFSDASPLMKALILQLSAGTGWPYYMISSDAGDANLGGNQIQEGPTSVMVDDEREFFFYNLLELFLWVCEIAMQRDRLPSSLWDDFYPDAYWPSVVVRDRQKETQANNILHMAGVLSRPEWCRMENIDPDQALEERIEDMETGMFMNPSAQNQTNEQKAKNQQANQGDGQNQGDQKPIEHKDNQNAKGNQ